MLKEEANFRVLKECNGNRNNKVYVVEHVPTHQRMILKMIKIKDQEKQLEEVRVHKKLNHKFVINFLDYDIKDNYIRVLIEFAKFGDMFELLPKLPTLGEFFVLKIFYQILRAVDYLHSQGLAHRDIKPENILITDKMVPKLADFGTTKDFFTPRITFCGTYEYMAPEIFEKKYQTLKVDIWSLGILLFEMTHLTTPFAKNQLSKVEQILAQGTIPFKDDINPDIKRLVLTMLQFKPERRPTCESLLRDVLFSRFHKRESCNPPILNQPPAVNERAIDHSLKTTSSLKNLDRFELTAERIDLEISKQLNFLVCSTMNDLPANHSKIYPIEKSQVYLSPKKDSMKKTQPSDSVYYSAGQKEASIHDNTRVFKKKSNFSNLISPYVELQEEAEVLKKKEVPSCEDLSTIKSYFTNPNISKPNITNYPKSPISEALTTQKTPERFTQQKPKFKLVNFNGKQSPGKKQNATLRNGYETILKGMDLEKLKEMQLAIKKEIKKKEAK